GCCVRWSAMWRARKTLPSSSAPQSIQTFLLPHYRPCTSVSALGRLRCSWTSTDTCAGGSVTLLAGPERVWALRSSRLRSHRGEVNAPRGRQRPPGVARALRGEPEGEGRDPPRIFRLVSSGAFT